MPTRAARQDCPTEMWSSPVFFCRNGPCGQQKKPRGSVQLEPQGAHKDPEQHQQIHVQQQPPHLRMHRAVVQRDSPPCEQAQIQQAPEDAAGFLQTGGHPLQREHPAQPCQQHHGAHRTASLNLFSLPLPHLMPASFFCAVLRWFFSIISHPCCNLPESREGMYLCAACACSENRLNCKTIF